MAVIIYQPKQPLNQVIQEWVNEAEAQLIENMNTQFIWPVEVYPGYREVNEKRKRRGGWYSTGQGEKSIGGRVAEASNPGNVTVVFHWNDYLDFVDRGVGKGRPSQSIDRERKAHFQDRYIGMWNTRCASKQTSRPAFFMEMRHMESRIQNYLEDYYGYEGSMRTLKAFDNLQINFNFD